MPIPDFSINGVLPPYVGARGPGDSPEKMSPYQATPLEVVDKLGTSSNRRDILVKWLNHRSEIGQIGFVDGFQWLDGSFVEEKEPNDLDVVTFTARPSAAQDNLQLSSVIRANAHLFSRGPVKSAFRLDSFFIDLNGSPKTLVNSSRYLLGLFSHRRDDDLWKGMLHVSLDPSGDQEARIRLEQLAHTESVGIVVDDLTDNVPVSEEEQ